MAANIRGTLLNEDFEWGLYATGEAAEMAAEAFVQIAEQLQGG